ncbi:MAG TPA: hypothetical protein VMV00_01460, partial [Candidatus Baltobacteraceae bacterium]|nr:hypothetical protein [Candidatus Baltobacteraceae bacterium]
SAVVMQQAFKIMTSSGQAQQKYAKELFDSYKTEEKVSSAAPFVPNSDVTRSTTPISDYTGWNGYLKAMSGAYKAALVDATVGTIYKPWYDKYTESGRDEKRKEEEKKKAEEQAQKEKDAMKKAEEDAAAKSEEGAAE